MQIERVAAPTRAEFERNFVHKRRPVILTGVVDQWKAFSTWNLDHFRSIAGEKKLMVRCFPEGEQGDWATSTAKMIRLAKYIEYLEGPSRPDMPYLEFISLQIHLPELASDVRMPIYFDEKRLFNVVLFLGRDTLAPLHYHPVEENFLCQIFGRKKVQLYPPEQSHLLYPVPWNTPRAPGFSEIRVEDPDYDRFPRFREARPIEFFLEAGEMLFIPIHWWHVIYGLGVSASVAWFWKPLLAQQRFWVTSYLGRRYLANRLLKAIVKKRYNNIVRPTDQQKKSTRFEDGSMS